MAEPRSVGRKRRPAVSVRAFEPEDAMDVARLLTDRGVAAGTLESPFQSVAEVRERLLQRTTLNQHLLVAELEGQPVGLGSLQLQSRARVRHVADLGMVLRRDAPAQEVSRALLDALLELAGQWLGILRVELKVWVDDKEALALYRARGFVIEGVARAYGLRDGRLVDAFLMARVAEQLPYERLTAEEVSQRSPPQLTSGSTQGAKRNGNGSGTGWGFGGGIA